MKKNKMNSLLKFGILLFGVSFFIVSCQKDDDNNKTLEHQVAKINYLDINEIPNVGNALNQITSSSKSSRMMTTTFGSLNLSNILEFINTDGKETYSFLIEKETDSINPYSFENLHLVKISQGYLAYVLKWIPNEQWLETNDFDLQNFTGTQKHYDLEYNLIQENELINGTITSNTNGKTALIQNKRDMVLVCVETVSSLCSGYPYNCGGSICGFGYSSDCGMVYVGGGGQTGGDGTSNGGGNGGGSIINTNDTETDHHDSTSNPVDGGAATVVTISPEKLTKSEIVIECLAGSLTPQQTAWINNIANKTKVGSMANSIKKNKCSVMAAILLEFMQNTSQNIEEFIENELECYGIQTLMENTDFTDGIDNLEQFIEDNEEDEQGYEVSRIDGTISTNFVPGQYDKVILNHGGNIIGGMHTHPDQGNAMFSSDDIYKLYKYYTSTISNADINISQLDVFSVVVTENGTYMVKISDYINLGIIINNFFQNGASHKKAMRKLNNLLNKKIFKNPDEDDYFKSFLNAFNKLKTKYNLPKSPVKLYKLNNTTNTFDKVILDSSGEPDTEPCQ